MQSGVQQCSIVERDSAWADSRLHVSDSVQLMKAGGRATEIYQIEELLQFHLFMIS
jgi:hypothetical protein